MYSEALGREVRQVDRLIGHYAESHRHPSNVLIHWICVPIIVWCTLTLFWVIHPYLAAGASALAIVYYARLSLPFTLVMAAFAVACLASLTVLPHAGWIALALFVVTWVFQFIGHKIEGKKPSFFEDLQYLLVGPIFLLAKLFRRLGLPY
ncbi:MAG: DUF962 domain-containing protein [Xanthomonadales bacterium]|nr:DUF962 domain-containing protein [Xanthomonadales bacterium]